MKKIPKLKQTESDLAQQIKIIAVNTGLKDSLEKSYAFQKRFAINYALAFDQTSAVTELYGVWGTPTEFIIDIDGIIRHRDGVPDELEPLLAQWNQSSTEQQQSAVQLLAVEQDCDPVNKTC